MTIAQFSRERVDETVVIQNPIPDLKRSMGRKFGRPENRLSCTGLIQNV